MTLAIVGVVAFAVGYFTAALLAGSKQYRGPGDA